MPEPEPKKPDAYEIEPGEDPASPPPPAPSVPDESVHALDTCPNCSSPMPGSDTLICLGCGYDLKTMSVVETTTAAGDADEDPDLDPPALTRPGGPAWMPTALLATGLLVLAVATLAGWRGLFPELETTEAISFPTRLVALARLPVMLGLWTACAMIGLVLLAWLSERPLGDVPLAFGRAAGIAAIAMTSTLARVPLRFAEVAAEVVCATVVYFALTLVLFRTTPRDALKAAMFALLAFVALVVAARLVVWAV